MLLIPSAIKSFTTERYGNEGNKNSSANSFDCSYQSSVEQHCEKLRDTREQRRIQLLTVDSMDAVSPCSRRLHKF